VLYLKKIDVKNKGKGALYRQVADSLKTAISENRLPPGSPIPSENALCGHFNVARSVVRQALALLVDDGYILKQAGRSSVVAPRMKHRRNLQNSLSLHAQLEREGTRLQTSVIRLEQAAFPAEVAAFYGDIDGLLLERVRYIDDEPISYVKTWLPKEFASLSSEDLINQSLHRRLSERFNREPQQGRNQIQTVPSDKMLATYLKVKKSDALLQLQACYYDQHGLPLEWFTAWHRADRVVFDIAVDASLDNNIQVKDFQRTIK